MCLLTELVSVLFRVYFFTFTVRCVFFVSASLLLLFFVLLFSFLFFLSFFLFLFFRPLTARLLVVPSPHYSTNILILILRLMLSM